MTGQHPPQFDVCFLLGQHEEVGIHVSFVKNNDHNVKFGLIIH